MLACPLAVAMGVRAPRQLQKLPHSTATLQCAAYHPHMLLVIYQSGPPHCVRHAAFHRHPTARGVGCCRFADRTVSSILLYRGDSVVYQVLFVTCRLVLHEFSCRTLTSAVLDLATATSQRQ